MKPLIKMTGDKEARRMMQAVGAISAAYRNATLAGKGRADRGNNADVAEGLRDQGRNFFETEETAKAAAAAFARMTEVAAQKAKHAKTEGARRALAATVWTAAIKAAAAKAVENINSGNFEGGGSSSLSPDYAARKQKDHGFTMPIGKATGDLLNNLAAAGTIRLQKT